MTSARIGAATGSGFRLDVEFAIEAGITFLYGPHGSGKTTILDFIAGCARPDSGRILLEDAILFDGASAVFVEPNRRRCAYVGERDGLFPRMSVRRNLSFGAAGSPRLERIRRVSEMAEKFGLGAFETRLPQQTPREMRLRAEIARALLSQPKLLLVDDRGIDLAALRILRSAFAGPVVMACGDLDLCCAAGGRLILLDEGAIVQSGAAREVVDRPASVGAAKLLGFTNLFEGAITALDPGRGTCRVEFEAFALDGPYLPGHFRGDRVTVGFASNRLGVLPGDQPRSANRVSANLVSATPGARSVRLEFAGGITAEIAQAEFERQKENRNWLVEFPPDAMRAL